jgi:hypothetical protein
MRKRVHAELDPSIARETVKLLEIQRPPYRSSSIGQAVRPAASEVRDHMAANPVHGNFICSWESRQADSRWRYAPGPAAVSKTLSLHIVPPVRGASSRVVRRDEHGRWQIERLKNRQCMGCDACIRIVESYGNATTC